jgi:hypothetical protein
LNGKKQEKNDPKINYFRQLINFTFYEIIKFDELVKSKKGRFPVIPAKAGIQLFQILKNSLDSGFHRSDDFLRDHQIWVIEIYLGFGFWIFFVYGGIPFL